ncbi:hypothetical protein GCM10027048_45690 [Hymenobacter coalescens]
MKLLDFSLDEALIAANQAELSDTIRVQIYEESPELLERLDYDDDASFLEPALFYYFLGQTQAKQPVRLAQTLYGYLPAAHRPAVQPVQADATGVVFLPRLGCFQAEPHAQLLLHWDAAAQQLLWTRPGGEPLALPQQPERFLAGTTIRVAYHDPLILDEELNAQLLESPRDSAARNAAPLQQAAALLQQHQPAFLQLLAQATREVVLFNSTQRLSMATMTYHGGALLNVGTHPNSPVFFLDDLAHQSGHVVFNALTLQTDDFLRVHKLTPLNQFTGEMHDQRPIYGAFHGLFTYTSILHCLDYCLQHQLLSEEHRAEALARLGFYTRKFSGDMAIFPTTEALTPAGLHYHAMFASGLAGIEQRYQDYLQAVSYAHQPYLFDYARFQAQNAQLPVA